MNIYCRVTLSPLSADGVPVSLPPELVGLDAASLADLPAALDPCPPQWVGVGYWPVVDVIPEHDPATHAPDGTWTLELQPNTATARRIAGIAPRPPPPPPTVADVIAERNRRLALGFEYDFADARGVHRIATTPDDMVGWDEVAKVSNAALALGEPGRTILIKTQTAPTLVTALEWQEILLAAGEHRQPIWQASFVLQDMTPIPADFTDDQYWPAAPPPPA